MRKMLRPATLVLMVMACGLAGAQTVREPATTDPGILKAPPANAKSGDMERAPPANVDPQMTVPPPADAGAREGVRPPAGAASRPRPPSSNAKPAISRSRQDDCRGPAALCKQDSAR
jgi:hypothetical protein